MNKGQIERRLRELLERKSPIEQPGRLIGHLLNELNLLPDKGNRAAIAITQLLEKMEQAGEVRLMSSGTILNSVELLPKQVDSNTDQAEVQEPPVVIASKEETLQPQETMMDENVVSDGRPSHRETLSLALLALQCAADKETGVIRGQSAAKIIVQGLAQDVTLTEVQAAALNTTLGKLGYRSTTGARSTLQHIINMKVTEVTQAALDQLEAKPEKESEQPETEQQPLLPVPQEEVAPNFPEETGAMPLASPVEKRPVHELLAAIILKLEKNIEEKDDLIGRHEQAAIASAERIEGLVGANMALNEQLGEKDRMISSLQAQLTRLQAEARQNPLVANLLTKYAADA